MLVPVEENATRLLVRGEAAPANVIMRMVVEPIVFTMVRPMLLGLQARAEGQQQTPAALMFLAQLGWIAAGIAVAVLLISQRRRRYWLAFPILAALPALLMSSDIQAALAAFIAVGIVVLGFLIYGRNWWGPLLVIGPLVLLTLSLAPEAYTAIGLAFALLLLAALGAARRKIGRAHV